MSSKWIDISVSLHPGMVHWPGDPTPRFQRILDLARGDACTVSTLDMSAHTGTHIDAPLHYLRAGKSLDALPLDAAIGRARVIALDDPVSIAADELRRHRIRRGERLLFKTANSSRCWGTDWFIEDFVHVSTPAARFLAERRVRTVGVDYLSVGAFRNGGEETHRTLLEAGIWIIEGLNLARAEPGRYDLVCLPLRLAGAEGAPARAILRRVAAGR